MDMEKFMGYNILYKLGQGAFSSSYLAEQNGNMLVIKMIDIPNPTTTKNMSRKDLLGKEFQTSLRDTCSELNKVLRTLVSSAGGKGILRYYDYQISMNRQTGVYQLAILTEYKDSLFLYASRNPLNVRKVIKMGMDCCDGLEFMRNREVMHGNIKESNIFYDPIKGFKLGDFFFNDVLINTLKPRETYEDYGYRFLAPEAYSVSKFSSRLDIFSLAILIYKLLNNSLLPYQIQTGLYSPKELREKFIEKGLPPSPYIDPAIYSVLRQAAAPDERQRYKNFAELRDALKEARGKMEYEDLDRAVFYEGEDIPLDMPSAQDPPEIPKEAPKPPSFEIVLPPSDRPEQETAKALPKEDRPLPEEIEPPPVINIRGKARPEPPAQEALTSPKAPEIEIVNLAETRMLPSPPAADTAEIDYTPGAHEKSLMRDHPELNDSTVGSPPAFDKNDKALYSYYDEEDDENRIKNTLSTVAFVIAIVIIAVVVFLLAPYLGKIFGEAFGASSQ
ncbi:MAG: protein kinase [Oscillospiraceae bacterium]|jgi:serine/threonine protein kinase|nr:protein kinase [Oscillospiraceae bacterium]